MGHRFILGTTTITDKETGTTMSKNRTPDTPKKQKTFKVPHTYIIVSGIIVIMAMLTWFVPSGTFRVKTVTYTVTQNGQEVEKERVVPVEGSFEVVKDEHGHPKYGRKGIFDILQAPFLGFTDHDAVEVIAFILLIGGAFGVLIKTGAVESTMLKVISQVKGSELFMIPVLMLIFSLGGAVFGMAEETIPFTMILVPITIAMGYDSITAICIGFVGSQIGFSTAFMNPFTLGIAQGIAGVPYMSGFSGRCAIWALFTLIGIVMVMRYALAIKKTPEKSPTFEIDQRWRNTLGEVDLEKIELTRGHIMIMLSFLGCMIWLIWGVIAHGYYLVEISMIFLAVGVMAGIIAVLTGLMTVNETAKAFESGAADLLTAAIIVGFAKGILYVMGGAAADSASILNTFLFYTSSWLKGFGMELCAFFMYVFQSVFNFFVVSGSGQAALTMPLMAPLGEMVGMTKEMTILAFQFGDGFTNMIVPTNTVLIGVLTVARVPWPVWAKWQLKKQVFWFVLAAVTLMIAVGLGFGG
jgi:uncharacterized ion transporter superfamily protein YfcC